MEGTSKERKKKGGKCKSTDQRWVLTKQWIDLQATIARNLSNVLELFVKCYWAVS